MSPQSTGGPQDPTPCPDFLTSTQVAERLKVSRSTVFRLATAGHFPGTIQVGVGTIRRRGLRIPETAVSAYVAASALPLNEEP